MITFKDRIVANSVRITSPEPATVIELYVYMLQCQGGVFVGSGLYIEHKLEGRTGLKAPPFFKKVRDTEFRSHLEDLSEIREG